ncbi:Endolytic peptidoglycan transglycosylase RlpA [Burkholderiales bacterium 8X]|nr:Endolytic peptidoglycan transglycosylase RlpA [Burkholderiales bacterium 8X]
MAVLVAVAGCTAPPKPADPGGAEPGATATTTARQPGLRPLAVQPSLPPGSPPRSQVPSVRYDLSVSGTGEVDDGLPGDEAPVEVFERGGASWYGIQFHQRKTANGERFDMSAMTAAHKTLPFNTRVCVRSLVNGREVLVRINDRGPYAAGRIIDLSQAAADAIGMVGQGIKQVSLSVVTPERTRCGDKRIEPEDSLASPPDDPPRRLGTPAKKAATPVLREVPPRLRR